MSFNVKEGSIKIVHPHQASKVSPTAGRIVELLKENWLEQRPLASEIAVADFGEGKAYAEPLFGRAATWGDLEYFRYLDGLAQNANPPGTPDDEV
jgi:hypothetical protein